MNVTTDYDNKEGRIELGNLDLAHLGFRNQLSRFAGHLGYIYIVKRDLNESDTDSQKPGTDMAIP